MIDKTIGKTFRNLRKAKNMEIKEIANPTFSYSQVSKFETGKSSITAEKLFDGLLSLNISILEFSKAYHENKGTDDYLVLSDIEKELYLNSPSKLKSLLKDAKRLALKYPEKSRFRLNEILIKSILKTIDPDYIVPSSDIAFLKNYLLNLDIFSSFEFWLLSYCALLFDSKTLSEIVEGSIHQKQFILDFPQLRQLKYDFILSCIDIFLKRDFLEPLPGLFHYLHQSLDSPLLLYEKATFTYLKAVYDLKVDFENAQAKQALTGCIATFGLLDCFALVDTIKKEVADYFPDYQI